MYLNQDAFVNNRNYPGGPGQFEIEQYDLTYNAVCTVVYIVGTWFTDGLLVRLVLRGGSQNFLTSFCRFSVFTQFLGQRGGSWWSRALYIWFLLVSNLIFWTDK